MSILDILLLAVSLAMDCFTVSIVSGAILGRWQTGVIVRIAVLFGLFQGVMPLLGWLAVSFFASHLEAYGRWIASSLLLFIGLRMVWEALHGDSDTQAFNPRRLSTQLLLAVATSIDALAVGVSMAVTGYTTALSLVLPLTIIALVSLMLSLLGHHLGLRFGRAVSKRLKPEVLGGVVLVALGLKVLLVS